MKRCCVIGGAGFIGRQVVPLLQDAGYEVVVVDRGARPALLDKGVQYAEGDYADQDFLKEILAGAEAVIHLAYASVPKTSFEDPAADLLHNIPPALGLFEVAASLGVVKLVVVSSGGTVYGQAQLLPITEDHPTNPISPYGITKLAIEKYAGLFFVLKNLPVVIVRPANAYGEEQRPFTGQGLIATAAASMLEGKEITIFGENGSVRDYIHVADVASGIVAALEKGKPGECYNLGTGVGTHNREIVERLAAFAAERGITPVVSSQPPRSFDVDSNVLDSGKMQRDTGWSPEVTLEAGLRRVWDYQVEGHA